MAFNLLGPLDVLMDDVPLPIHSDRELSLVAKLALHHGKTVPFDELIATIWGDDPPATSRNQLSICVSAVRRKLGVGREEVIETTPVGYRLRAAAGRTTTDLVLARHLADEAKAEWRPQEAARKLGSAIALWRGATLEGIGNPALRLEAEAVERWRAALREEYARLRIEAGLHQEVVEDLRKLIAVDPYRESLRILLMRALYGAGHRTEALAVYAEIRRLLSDDLGIDPGAELAETHAMILRGDLLARTGGSAQADVAAGFPIPRRLPPPPARLCGRETELAHLDRELRRADEAGSPFRTAVTGLGGIGKTALVLHWAHAVADSFPDGQLYADLHGSAPLSVNDVLCMFLCALGVPGATIPPHADDRAAMFRAAVEGKRILIVLENARSSQQVRPFLTSAPGCAVLVTSRYSLDGLAVLDGVVGLRLTALDHAASIALLGGALGTGQDLSRLADLGAGVPLALRIMAGQLTLHDGWSVERLARRLADERGRLAELSRGEVQLKSVLDAGYAALSQDAARLFRLMSLVDAPDLPEWSVGALAGVDWHSAQDLVRELLDTHLVESGGEDSVGQMRYRMNTLVRLYAEQQARRIDPADQHRTALERYLFGLVRLLREADRRVTGGAHQGIEGAVPEWRPDFYDMDAFLGSPTPICWHQAERRTISLAIAQACELGMDEAAWQLVTASMPFYLTFQKIEDWYEAHDRALAATRAAGNRRGETALLLSAGVARTRTGHSAADILNEALAKTSDQDDPHGWGVILTALGDDALQQAHPAEAVDHYEAARTALPQECPAHISAVLGQTRALIESGDLTGARQALKAVKNSLVLSMAWPLRAQAARCRGLLELAHGDHHAARSHLETALDLAQGHVDLHMEAQLLCDMTTVALADGNFTDATRKLTAAQALARKTGNRHHQQQTTHLAARLRSSRSLA